MYSQYEGPSNYAAKDSVNPVVNSDVFADRVPVDATLIHETPMGGTVASVEPLNGPAEDAIPMYDTPNQLIPMGGTVATVDPANTELRDEAIPMYDAPVEQAPMAESMADVSPVNAELRSDSIPMYETPVQQAQKDWTAAEVQPMNREMAADSIPMYETPVKEISLIETVPVVEQVHDTIPSNAPTSAVVPSGTPLLTSDESAKFRTHWNEIQGKFVDEPKTAVQQADALVTEVIAQITQTFTNERTTLEGKWNQNNDVTTEELLKSLQLYRSFFNRLVV